MRKGLFIVLGVIFETRCSDVYLGLAECFGRFPILVKTAIRLSRCASILLDTHAMCSVEIHSCHCAIVCVGYSILFIRLSRSFKYSSSWVLDNTE